MPLNVYSAGPLSATGPVTAVDLDMKMEVDGTAKATDGENGNLMPLPENYSSIDGDMEKVTPR